MTICLLEPKDKLFRRFQIGFLSQFRSRFTHCLTPHLAMMALVLGLATPIEAFARDGANASVDLQRDMSAESFKKAGLHRLSADELAALQAWLSSNTESVMPATPLIPSTSPAVAPVAPVAESISSPSSDPELEELGAEQLPRSKPLAEESVAAIETQIAGKFRGWDGKTLFRLTNGQIWQQRVRGRYRYRAESPEVRVERGRFGYYLMLVESGRKIGVKRVK